MESKCRCICCPSVSQGEKIGVNVPLKELEAVKEIIENMKGVLRCWGEFVGLSESAP